MDRLSTERRPGIWQSEELESDRGGERGAVIEASLGFNSLACL